MWVGIGGGAGGGSGAGLRGAAGRGSRHQEAGGLLRGADVLGIVLVGLDDDPVGQAHHQIAETVLALGRPSREVVGVEAGGIVGHGSEVAEMASSFDERL